MASSPASSHSSVSGLGIIYQPMLSPTAPSFAPGAPASAVPQHLRAAGGRKLQHSVSHDAGLRQYAQSQQSQQYYQAGYGYGMHGGAYDTAVYRQDGRGGVVRMHQKAASPEADFGMGLGGGYQPMQDYPTYRIDTSYAQLSPGALSPHTYSSASASPSGGSDYSPQRMSSLPSADSHSGLQPPFYSQHLHPTLHHAPTSYSSPECSAYSAEAAYHMGGSQASTSGAAVAAGPHDAFLDAPEPTLSRLPAFLLEKRQRGLARPQSMLELGERHAKDAQPRPDEPAVVLSREKSEDSQIGARYTPIDDRRASSYTVCTVSSVPSSAGGLQRRHYERQLGDVRAHAAAAVAAAQSLAHSASSHVLHHSKSQDSLGSSRAPRPVSRQERTRTRSRSMSGAEVARLAHRAEDEPRRSPALGRPAHSRTKSDIVNMRSFRSMRGLAEAEDGGTHVQLSASGAGFAHGGEIGHGGREEDGVVSESGEEDEEEDEDEDAGEAEEMPRRIGSVISHVSGVPSAAGSYASQASHLSRQSTLLTAGANPTRRQHELNRLLQPTSAKKSLASAVLPTMLESPASASTASLAPASRAMSRASSQPTLCAAAPPVILEQAKSSAKARVELDLVLESGLVVEGGALRGKIEVKVRKPKGAEPELWLGAPKVRVVGFEELAGNEARHIFFHHAASVDALPDGEPLPLRSSVLASDEEGFRPSVEGTHHVPFRMQLPVGKGAKGTWKCKQGSVRYIVIASVKLKSADGQDRSIAHFYRSVEVFPYLPPAVALAPAPRPIAASESKALFMGGSGKVTLTATIHRRTWLAGQRCYVDVRVDNDSTKKIKTLALALVRTTTVFRARPWLHAGSGTDAAGELEVDPDACATSTTRKKVAEAVLEMGRKGAKGVTAKGSWMGVEAGERAGFSHSLLVPAEELTVPRGRHLEVVYAIKVSVGGSLSSDVAADLPVRLINFVSIDPPPGHVAEGGIVLRSAKSGRRLNKSWSTDQLKLARQASGTSSAKMTRMDSVDELGLDELNHGSPLLTELGPDRLASRASAANPTPSTVYSVNLASHLDSLSLADHDGHSPPSAFDSPVDPTTARFQGQAGRTLERQMSLECISSAVASATARRSVPMERARSGLSVETTATVATEDDFLDERDRREADEVRRLEQQHRAEQRIELDDLDEDEDELEREHEHERGGHRDPAAYSPSVLDFAADSEDEIDAVMQGGLADDDDDDDALAFDASSAPPTARQRERSSNSAGGRSPALRNPSPASPRKVIGSVARPASPAKTAAAARAGGAPVSPGKAGGKFGYASPGSPVKARGSTAAGESTVSGTEKGAHSPVRRVLSHASLASSATGPPRRPLPPAPAGTRPSSAGTGAAARVSLPPSPTKVQMGMRKQSSLASLRVSSGALRKAASARSLRPASHASPSSASDASPTFSFSAAEDVGRSPSTLGSSPDLAPKAPAMAGASPTISISAAEGSAVAVASPALGAARKELLAARSPRRSPSLSPRAAQAQAQAAPRSPRALHSTKSLSSLRSASSSLSALPTSHRDRLAPLPSARGPAPTPPPRTRPVVLASVKSKIAAMESRQDALRAFAAKVDGADSATVGGGGAGPGLGRQASVSSVASEAPSFRLADLERANSVASFKAPLLKRRTLGTGQT